MGYKSLNAPSLCTLETLQRRGKGVKNSPPYEGCSRGWSDRALPRLRSSRFAQWSVARADRLAEGGRGVALFDQARADPGCGQRKALVARPTAPIRPTRSCCLSFVAPQLSPPSQRVVRPTPVPSPPAVRVIIFALLKTNQHFILRVLRRPCFARALLFCVI